MIDDETILGIVEPRRDDSNAAAKELIGAANRSGGEDNITVVFFEMTDKAPEPPAETKAMPVMQPPDPPSTEADEDTLSGLEGVAGRPDDGRHAGAKPERAQTERRRSPSRRRSASAFRRRGSWSRSPSSRRLALLVYWLLGQSR